MAETHTAYLKLPSLVTEWPFWTFHNQSHNMKAWGILSHSLSHFAHLFVYMETMNFSWEKTPTDYPCKPLDHDHQWADLVMAWLPLIYLMLFDHTQTDKLDIVFTKS